jgi:hypothetical protein
MKYRLIIFISIMLLFTALGCKKSKQNKLTGSWDLLPQTSDQQNDKVVYKFNSDNILFRVKNDTIIDTADYNLRSDFFKYYVDITGLDQYNDGKYLIEKLNKKVLILQCPSPYLRKEFTKHEE